eukprot:SAG22_NODE_322_length_12387_cov_50.101400_5_plen_277_part_00
MLWKGESAIAGAAGALARLATTHGKRCFFVTNDSTRSRAACKEKFDRLGLGAHVEAGQMLTSSFAAAAYFNQTGFKKTAFVIGEQGIMDELALAGIPALGGPAFSGRETPDMSQDPDVAVEVDPSVGAVVAGLDRGINYYKLQYAQRCLNSLPGCEFVATNLDETAHLMRVQPWAEAGAMVGAVKGCTGKEPTLVGKPSPLLLDYLADEMGLDRVKVCMVGDRLDTDIRFGAQNGLRTVLVMSGVTTLEQLEALHGAEEEVAVPEFYTDSIATLVP